MLRHHNKSFESIEEQFVVARSSIYSQRRPRSVNNTTVGGIFTSLRRELAERQELFFTLTSSVYEVKIYPCFFIIVFAKTVKIMNNGFYSSFICRPVPTYYVLYNLSYDVTRWTKLKVMHISFGLISPNWLKLCRLTQSTRLNITMV